MKALKSILATTLIASGMLASCGNSTDSEKSKELTLATFTNNKDAEKQQLFLRIVEQSNTDSSYVYIAKSVFEQDTVGLQIEVLNGIKPGINDQGQPIEEGFVNGAIKLSSIGIESDALVKSLASMFKMESSGTMTSNQILPTVFSSNAVEVDLSKTSTYSFKLFFDNAVSEPAEMFATLDLYKRSFELSEKDASYRAQFLSALQGE